MSQAREALRARLKGYGKAAVAFSAGVDSTYLLAEAVGAMGAQNVLALTIHAQMHAAHEIHEARVIAKRLGVRHIVLEMDVFALPQVVENPPLRCYFCKKEIFSRLFEAARAEGFSVVLDGSNADDRGDYRPGMKALTELGVESPLLQAGMTKAEIRQHSRELGLSTADKPALACLATRIPTGTPLTESALRAVEAAEKALFSMGFSQARVRAHGELARLEVPKEELAKAVAQADAISAAVQASGFRWCALDLSGYRMGSMNAKGGREA